MKVSKTSDAKEVSINKNEDGWTLGWLKSGTGAVSNNTEVVGTLTTASNWNFLVPDTSPLKDHITGGPTYQQFAKSWNKKNSAIQTMDETTPTCYSNLKDSTGMYVITDTKSDTIFGYWLASDNPTVKWAVDYMWAVHKNGYMDGFRYHYDEFYGVRPVVHLTSDIKISRQDANGVWQIAQ